uniref:DWNN domain-containing protein n=1 Tax=Oryza glaberrima TaxID=4538 RepID=I1PB17_ORYGL
MAVFYRYRSEVDTFSMPVPEPFVSVAELKRLITATAHHGHGRSHGRGPRESVALYSDNTGEEYADEAELIRVHTKRRNKLLYDRMRDIVFVKLNSKLINKRDNKDRDPLEKEVNDAVSNDENEFITGIVPFSNELAEDDPQDGASQGESS